MSTRSYFCPKCGSQNIGVQFVGDGSFQDDDGFTVIVGDDGSYSSLPGAAATCRSCLHMDALAAFDRRAKPLDQHRELVMCEHLNVLDWLAGKPKDVMERVVRIFSNQSPPFSDMRGGDLATQLAHAHNLATHAWLRELHDYGVANRSLMFRLSRSTIRHGKE